MALDNSDNSNRNISTNRDAKRKACDVCKRRKVRCTGENPCQNCVRNGALCQYTLSHGRIAHLERRVARLQDRIRLFEASWTRFVPDVELSIALHAVESQLSTGYGPPEISRADIHGSSPNTDNLATRSFENTITLSTDHRESEHEDADALDWDESIDVAATADGIGSLSINSRGIGYMGPQSGNSLLRSLQSISMLLPSPFDSLTLQQSPGPKISEAILRSSTFTNQCVDWYFKYYHCAYPVLHEGYFRAQLMGALPKPRDGSWPILLNTVLAIGASSSNLCDQHADIYYYREGCRHLSWDILQRGTLSLVQAFALLANYLQKRNRPNSGFTLLGVAMNMAQGIGLHRELSGPTISTFTMEIRRRVWWTLFIFDSGARFTFGRPTLGLGGINTLLPRNLNDKDLAVDLDDLPPARDVPTVTSSLIWQTKLATISNLANEKLLEKRFPEPSVMLEIGEQVIAWSESLPSYMRAEFSNSEYGLFDVPRMVLLWRAMHLRIVIHRPFVLDFIKQRNSMDLTNPQTPASRCLQAAEECQLSIHLFWNSTQSHHGSLVWYACYWLVTAVFVHVTCILYDPKNSLSMLWRQNIETSKTVLESMGQFEPTALRAAQIIDQVMALVPSSPDSAFFAINEPIRLEVAELWNQSLADMVVPQEPSPPNFL